MLCMSSGPDYRPLIRDPDVLRRMQIAFDLYETAEQMKRQNILRRNPDATGEEIEEGIRRWLQPRPESEHDARVFRPPCPELLAPLKREPSPGSRKR